MIELTDSARQRFDEYLRRLRSALRGSPTVQADDVEQSVREHVEVALAGIPSPVSTDLLAPVLERLGPPERWLPENERPAWRRVMDRIATGPEDWRLAWLSFGLFLLMIVTFAIGGVLLLLPAYFVSRAYVEFLEERGETMGARRWLVYPAIAFVFLSLLGALLIGPVAPVLAWGIGNHGFRRIPNVGLDEQHVVERIRIDAGFIAVSFGAWWIVASAILAMLYRPIRFAFKPLLDGVTRKHLLLITFTATILLVAGLVALYA